MRDADRFMLHNSPYECPKCSVGDTALCTYRDHEIVVGMTDAPIL